MTSLIIDVGGCSYAFTESNRDIGTRLPIVDLIDKSYNSASDVTFEVLLKYTRIILIVLLYNNHYSMVLKMTNKI